MTKSPHRGRGTSSHGGKATERATGGGGATGRVLWSSGGSDSCSSLPSMRRHGRILRALASAPCGLPGPAGHLPQLLVHSQQDLSLSTQAQACELLCGARWSPGHLLPAECSGSHHRVRVHNGPQPTGLGDEAQSGHGQGQPGLLLDLCIQQLPQLYLLQVLPSTHLGLGSGPG